MILSAIIPDVKQIIEKTDFDVSNIIGLPEKLKKLEYSHAKARTDYEQVAGAGLNTQITNPTDGQVLKYNATTEKWENGTGGGGGGGPSSSYLFTQSSPSDTWVVTHGLNDSNPFVTVYSPTDEMVEPETITIDSANQLTITFGSAVSGIAKILGDAVVTPTTSITTTTASMNATGGDYIRADASAGDITITLIEPVQAETVTVKKIDSSDNSVFVQSALLIDGEEIVELSEEDEVLGFYYTGVTYDII